MLTVTADVHSNSALLLTSKQVGMMLGVTDRVAARLMRTGKIRAFRFSDSLGLEDRPARAGPWRTTPDAVRNYIAVMMRSDPLRWPQLAIGRRRR